MVRNDLKKRRATEKLKMLDDLITYDKEWRRLFTEVSRLRHRRNVITAKIARLKKNGEDVSEKIKEAERIPRRIKKLEEQVKKYEREINYILLRLPNILHESVPIGTDESDNVPIRKWGKIPKFDFPVKDHIDLGLSLDAMDIERAAKISVARF